MKKEFTERRLVKIYLEEADWKWVELQAQGNVSRWCREKLLESRNQRAVDMPRGGKIRHSKRGGGASIGVSESGIDCQHGVKVGKWCGYCKKVIGGQNG